MWCINNLVVWSSGSALVSINEVNLRWARWVPGWVTVSSFNSRCRTFISICNQLTRPTQPSIPTGWVNEDFIWEGKGRYGSFRYRMNAGCAGKTGRYFENACHSWAPQRCVHIEVSYKSTFTFTFTLRQFVHWTLTANEAAEPNHL